MSLPITTFLYTTFLACDDAALGAGRHQQNSFSCRHSKMMEDEEYITADATNKKTQVIIIIIISDVDAGSTTSPYTPVGGSSLVS